MKNIDAELTQVDGERTYLGGFFRTSFLETKCPDCGNIIKIKKNKNASVIICPHCHRCINIS